jgi:hypothetical protein
LHNQAAFAQIFLMYTAAMLKAPAYIFYPTLIVWSTLYGVAGGALFKLLAVYENWQATNRYHIKLWKKYPQRSYHKYISSMWASQIRGMPVELAEYTKLQLEKRHPAEPFPIVRLAVNTVFMLFITPFMVVMGMVRGPLYVYRKLMTRRNLELGQQPASQVGAEQEF